MTDVPNPPRDRPWRPMTALVETDWYPASYPWHCVVELDPKAKRVTIARGEVLCRVVPVRRGHVLRPADVADGVRRLLLPGAEVAGRRTGRSSTSRGPGAGARRAGGKGRRRPHADVRQAAGPRAVRGDAVSTARRTVRDAGPG